MKKLSASIAAGAALFAGVAAPATAGAATTSEASPQTVLVGGRCASYGTVRINTSAVNVYTGAGTDYRVVKTVYRGNHLSCWPIIVGHAYSLCGVTSANGWIPVDSNADGVRDGYVPSVCTTDD